MILFVALLMSGAFTYVGIVPGSLFIFLFLAIFLYGLSQIALSLTISAFFRDQRMAVQLGFFMLLVPMIIFIMATEFNPKAGDPHFPTWMYTFFFFPQFPMAIISTQLAGAKFHPAPSVNLSPAAAWIALVIDVFLYFGLFYWLDQILPDTYGIAKHPCFCFRKKNRPDRVQHEAFGQGDAAIKIEGLTKKFGKFRAVDGLNLEIRQNEIMALLGHNGAGKTTAIYMLTGLYKPDGGDASVYGCSLVDDLDGVRQSIGLCQQFDVLYDQLTV